MGNYTVNLMDRLGQGSFGVVYKGKEKKSGKVVAVKQIKVGEGDQGMFVFNCSKKNCHFARKGPQASKILKSKIHC